MSQVQGDIDLSALARKTGQDLVPRPKKSLLRVLVPLGIALAFLGVLASTLTDLLLPTVAVRIVRPGRIEAGQRAVRPAGQVLVQAAGWIQPDPFPIHASALAAGVVREVLVQESDRVVAGDPVARLIDEDARLKRDRRLAERDQARADHAAREVDLVIARERFEQAIEVTEALGVTRAELSHDDAVAQKAAGAVEQGRARILLAESELLVQQDLEAKGASGLRQVEIAEASLREARGLLAALEAEAARAQREVEKDRAKLIRAEADLATRFVDRQRLELAGPAVEAALARLAGAEAALAEAELELERMTVRAPAPGVVLQRLAAPGMALAPGGSGGVVCALFDPASIRVRVDVPQSEVEQIFVGQQAEITTQGRSARPYHGEVLRIVQRADIQKVTLEAQVRITDGDEWIRPEMLAQVRFLSSGELASGPETSAEGVLVPKALVQEGRVWVLDAAQGTATARSVEVLGEQDGNLIVTGEIDLSSKLLDGQGTQLTEGMRVRAGETR